MIRARRHRIGVVCGLAAFSLVAAESGAALAHSRYHHKRHGRHHAASSHLQRSGLGARLLVPQQCPGADNSVTSASTTTMRDAVRCLTNQERNAFGLPSLRASSRLNNVAQTWAQTMVATDAFEHPPNLAARFSASGYDWQAIGEDIATGFTTPTAVVTAWMASAEHCRNILDPSFRDVGVGAVGASVGGVGTSPGTWTEDFGLVMSQSAPSANYRPQSGCPY